MSNGGWMDKFYADRSKPGMILRLIFLAATALIVVYLILTSGEGKSMSTSTAVFWSAILLVLVATMALFSAWFRRVRN